MPGQTSPRRLQLLHVGPRGAAVDGLGEGAAERPKAFFDAVVAIAMTLLILPLMESVGDVADASGTAGAASARLL